MLNFVFFGKRFISARGQDMDTSPVTSKGPTQGYQPRHFQGPNPGIPAPPSPFPALGCYPCSTARLKLCRTGPRQGYLPCHFQGANPGIPALPLPRGQPRDASPATSKGPNQGYQPRQFFQGANPGMLALPLPRGQPRDTSPATSKGPTQGYQPCHFQGANPGMPAPPSPFPALGCYPCSTALLKALPHGAKTGIPALPIPRSQPRDTCPATSKGPTQGCQPRHFQGAKPGIPAPPILPRGQPRDASPDIAFSCAGLLSLLDRTA